jgi:hypothetical protein
MTFTRIKNILCGKWNIIFSISVLSCTLYILFHYYNTTLIAHLTVLIDNIIAKNITISYYNSTSTKENNTNQTFLYYRQVISGRNSSYPYISGDTFRGFSDYVLDETRQDNLSSIKYGDVVFVKADMLSLLFNPLFTSIRNPFVLITHNSDVSAPMAYKKYLSHSKILMWYASNPSEENHRKLTPIPIGLANKRWSHGDVDKFTYAFKNYRKPWSQRTMLLYANFEISTNRVQREKALSQASKIENAQIMKERITFETYLEQIGNAKFVLSPPGSGLDCHRTWEALLMGAVPIVLKSTLDPLFKNTRSVIINDWSKLTLDFLSSLNFSSNDHVSPDVLYAHYWRQKVFNHRKD